MEKIREILKLDQMIYAKEAGIKREREELEKVKNEPEEISYKIKEKKKGIEGK